MQSKHPNNCNVRHQTCNRRAPRLNMKNGQFCKKPCCAWIQRPRVCRLMRVCWPGDFDGRLSQIFHADRNFSRKDCHVIGYGPFGRPIVWSERHWIVDTSLINGPAYAGQLYRPEKKLNANAAIVASALGFPADTLDAYDDDNKKLFTRAIKKLGRPGPNEAFGFFPALTKGGAPNLENLKIVPALEHFLFLAQLQQFQLVDNLSQPPSIVRPIG